MRRTSFRDWPCSIARTVDLLGDWWSPLILRDACMGARRFEQFQESLGIGRNVLAVRLRCFVDEELFEKRKYHDRPARYEYVLTEKGADLFGVLAAMMRWGDRWLDGGEGPPAVLRHRGCDSVTHAEVVCAVCGEPLRHQDMRLERAPERERGRAADPPPQASPAAGWQRLERDP